MIWHFGNEFPPQIQKIITDRFWKFLGFLFGFLFNFGIFILFVAVFFGILWLVPYWQPAYSIIYRIVGDKSISPVLEPYQLKLKWWQYISVGIKLAFIAYILYVGFKLILK